MSHRLHDIVRHNNWATEQIIAYCQGLDDATLQATTPGTFGTIIETLRHTINSEASYLFRLAAPWPAYPWSRDEAVGLAVVAERAAVIAAAWETCLAGDIDTERLGEGRGDDGRVFAIRGGIFLAQAIHHANEHRAHICTILGALGHEPPDVSAWGYALATGRSTEQ